MEHWEPFRPLTDHEKFNRECTAIADKYSGDFDTMPGLPMVTFTEMRLLQIIIKLEDRVHELEERMN